MDNTFENRLQAIEYELSQIAESEYLEELKKKFNNELDVDVVLNIIPSRDISFKTRSLLSAILNRLELSQQDRLDLEKYIIYGGVDNIEYIKSTLADWVIWKDKILAILEGAPEEFDSLIEIFNYIEQHIQDSNIKLEEINNNVLNLNEEVNKKLDTEDSPFEKGSTENSAVLKGGNNKANGNFSFAEGYNTFAKGDFSHAEGEGEKLQFNVTNITEEGEGTTFFYVQESTEDLQHGDILRYIVGNNEIWSYVFAVSDNIIKVIERFSPTPIAGGVLTIVKGLAYGQNSHSQNAKTVAFGDNSHAEGFLTSVRGFAAHGEGVKTKSDGWGSHAEGQNTKALGTASHAEGEGTVTEGDNSHAEGYQTKAQGNFSHAEGYQTKSIGEFSHSEGFGSSASAQASHAEGMMTTIPAAAQGAHTEGIMTEVTNMGEHAQGRYNKSNTVTPANPLAPTVEELGKATLHSVGIGMPTDMTDPTSAIIRMNAHEIMQDGKHYIIGIGGYDGTNAVTPNGQGIIAKSVQEVINELVNIINEITTSETN